MAVPHKDQINDAVTVISIASLIGRSPVVGGASIFVAIASWFSMTSQEGNHMWFTLQKEWMYAVLAIGILLSLFIGYFFRYQYAKINKQDPMLKFDPAYIVAFVVSFILAAGVSYLVTFILLPNYILKDTCIVENELAIVCGLIIGFAVAWVVDALFWHPIVDGTLATLANNEKKKILESTNGVDQEVFAAISAKAEAAGLVDEDLIKTLAGLVKSADAPDIATWIQLLKDKQKKKA